MIREIDKIARDLENKNNSDIIWKKEKIEKLFYNDPDLLEILGQKEKRPHIAGETKEEATEVDSYNEAISHKQILKYLKLNGVQKEVLNFVMFDILDSDTFDSNSFIKEQYLIVMCLVHEDDMDTEYGIVRTDLLAYIIMDLLCWTNELGMQLRYENNYYDIVDSKYYARTLKFRIQAPNTMKGHMGKHNLYDRFTSI